MYVKSYDPKRKAEENKKFIEKIKGLLAKKTARIFLFALSGALMIAAAAIFLIQWNEGEEAANKAEQLLGEISVQTSAADPFPSGVYAQPEAPDAQDEEDITTLLGTELKGYSIIARLDIEKIDAHLAVLSQWSVKALKVSVCYFSGPAPGAEGNLVITGHNYRSGAHFGKLDTIEVGDTVTLTDMEGNIYSYKVYKKELITPDNVAALDKTKYDNELTLVTCEANGNRRLLVRCALASLLG